MITVKKIIPFLVIIFLLLVIKNNIAAIFTSLSSTNTTKHLKNQLQAEKKENQYLSERLKYVQSDQFVEEQAEEKLGLLKSGEFFVIAPTSAPLDNKSVISNDKPNWKKWLELFF